MRLKPSSLRSKTHALLLALKRSSGELASYQQKMFHTDNLSADTNAVPPSFPVCYYATRNFMCQQALGLKMVFNRPVPVDHLESAIADKAQANTQEYDRRPST
ncbi:hypothetical protein BJY52DRAFT_1123768 [Lactarius psammicola]|nr:hypothetical protein BJY52DRAFT_1123768 [Lactarius psammicola]